MNPVEYGNILHFDEALNMYIVQVTPLTIAKVVVNKLENHVEIIRSGNIVLTYKDKLIDDNSFERIIGTNHYIYTKNAANMEYKLELFTVKKPARFIKPKKVDKTLCNKIITMDIETVNTGGKMKPYLLSWHDGKISNSYFLTDFDSYDDKLIKAVSDLTKIKYKSFKIYLHNFANFDAIFLLKILNKVGIVTPIIHKGRIITVSLAFSKKTESRFYRVYFRDSYQILQAILNKLAKFFGVDQKGIFPHKFVTETNLNYIGPVPAFEYFDGINYNEYLEYSKSFKDNWDLRSEAIKYCKQNCMSLYQVLTVFNELIFNKYQINMNKYPTLTTLSFTIFLTHYLPKLTFCIPMLSGKIAKEIRMSYTGGATEMYIPTNQPGELVYGYDVNSLYPSVMQSCEVPVGKPTYFEGDIRKQHGDAFGFFYCKITTPNNLIHPILQTHVKTKDGIRTVAALGTFEDMLFSAEIDNAMKLGYKFEIL